MSAPVQELGQYRFTFGDFNQSSAWSDRQTLSWPQLASILTHHEIGQKEGRCIVPATFSGEHRKKHDAVRIDVAFLDSDAGATRDEIELALRKRGWAGIISSTHSHLNKTTEVAKSHWEKYCAQTAGEAEHLPGAYLEEEKGYRSSVAKDARILTMKDKIVVIEHQPCPKFRVVVPLTAPWLAENYPDQAAANADWKRCIEALAHALSLDYDQSCVDTARLFYLPRRQADRSSETAVIEGKACDIFALSAPNQKSSGAAGQELKQSSRKSLEKKSDESSHTYTDPGTGYALPLEHWARQRGRSFQLVQALKATKPGVFVGHVADGVKHHIVCVNEKEHTKPGADSATFIVDADQSQTGSFVYHCCHAHCVSRDRLYFLRKMLEEGWLTAKDLSCKRFFAGAPDARRLDQPQQTKSDEYFYQPSVIRFVPGDLPSIVRQAEQALIHSSQGIYQRGSRLVRPGTLKTGVAMHGDVQGLSIIEMGEAALVEALTNAAYWEKYDARVADWVPMDAPNKVAKTLLDRKGLWNLPTLTGIISAPILRQDGSILCEPGYDPDTGFFLDLQLCEPLQIPDCPSQEQIHHAHDQLNALVDTFPFANRESRSVALSLILTTLIRPSLRTAPLHAFTAPTAGSGKSMLVDIACLIATGKEASVIAQGKSEEEMEKRIGALLLQGDSYIAIDNCEAPLGGDVLCQMLTQTQIRIRVLGRSEVSMLPLSATVTATGNNLVLAGDMTRRSIIGRLEPECERPELRRFEKNPIEMVKANRKTYLEAALTILRAYHVAGRPKRPDPLGSFEEWSNWIRGALVWLGEDDPVKTMEDARKTDPSLELLSTFHQQWKIAIGLDVRVKARDLVVKAGEFAVGSSGAEYRYPDLREALLAVAQDRGAISVRRLGQWLSRHCGRIVNQISIAQCPQDHGTTTWELQLKG